MSDRLAPLVDGLQRLAVDGDATSDAELLDRFLAGCDPAALELIVWRHGAMVQAVCRRVLGRSVEVEDAFQATFLVLLRQARSIRQHQSLAGWLHRVALNAALRCRRANLARRRRELISAKSEALPPDDPAVRDLGMALHAEIDRLPQRLRLPFVLCHLEGKTNDEAARLLGVPYGTVLSRLNRARERLRQRLVRRGVTLAAADAALLQDLEPVAATLVDATVRGAIDSVTGMVGGPAAAIAQGVIQAMFLRKFTFVTASVLAASALLGLGLMTTPALLNRVQADEQPPAAEAGRPAEQQPPAGEKPLPKGDAANQQPPPPKPVELPREQPAKPVERAPLDLLVPQKTLRVYHEDEANILGNWRVTSVVVDGQHRDPQDKTIVIGPFGTALVRNSTKPGDEQPMTYKLDPEAKPAAIDLIAAGKTQPGIYQVQGNALTLCMNVRDGARPTELIGSKGSGQVVLTLSRIGPASNTGWAQAILGQNATHDFGVIKPGDRVTHQVKIKNPYDRPISVASVATYSFRHQEDRALPGSVHPRLGSDLIEIPNSPLLVTASNLPTRWIEPGEEATITLEASSNQLRGAGKKAVLIHFQIRGLNGAPVPLGARLSGISGGAPFGPPAMGFVMRQHLGPEGALARLIVTARSADSQPKP